MSRKWAKGVERAIMEQSDAELISRYREGDIDALERLVERYRRPLYGYIVRMGRVGTDADEVFQEVWFRVIRKLARYRQKNFPGWLMRIAHNYVIDESRRKRALLTLDEPLESGEARIANVASADATPSEQVVDGELGLRIKSAVTCLPEEQKEVFLLRTKMDLPFKEIAKIQRVSINTALARMQYALAKLRDFLADDYAAMGRTI